MSNEIAKFFGDAQLPAAREDLVAGLMDFASTKSAIDGVSLLRLTKQDGEWVFGMDNEKWKGELIANPVGFRSGYIAWHAGSIEKEVMQPLSLGPIDPSTLPPVVAKKGWEPQVSVDLISRHEVPLRLIYKSSNRGGTRALLGLASAIAVGLRAEPGRVYPLIELGVDSYTHKEYGKIFTPVFTIVGWLDANGKPVETRRKLV